MERIPPHSEEAERSAIGAAMLSKDALLDVAEEGRSENKISSYNIFVWGCPGGQAASF